MPRKAIAIFSKPLRCDCDLWQNQLRCDSDPSLISGKIVHDIRHKSMELSNAVFISMCSLFIGSEDNDAIKSKADFGAGTLKEKDGRER